jgi:magnesium transporter
MTSRYLRRIFRSQQLPPGSLVYQGPPRDHTITIRQVVYGADEHREEVLPVTELASVSWGPELVDWIAFDGVHDHGLIERVTERFRLPPLIGEDLLAVGQRPKLEEFDGGFLVTARLLRLGPDDPTIAGTQLSLVLAENGVLSFKEAPSDVFDGVRGRIAQGLGRIRTAGADYLLYALLDAVLAGYSSVVGELADRIEELEETSLDEIPDDFPRRIRDLRKEAILVRRAMWPLREVFSSLLRSENPLIQPSNVPYVRDALDQLLQLLEAADVMKEALAALTEYHVSAVNQKANEIMMVLTLVATVFIPLTFLAGIYGMNFEYMPELAFRWAYPVLLVAMAGIATVLLLLFKRRGWL